MKAMLIVNFQMFLQVILSTEAPAADQTREGPLARVYSFVPSQFFVSGKGFATIDKITREWPLPRMDAYVTTQLAVIREGHLAIGTMKLFRSLLLDRLLMLLLLLYRRCCSHGTQDAIRGLNGGNGMMMITVISFVQLISLS